MRRQENARRCFFSERARVCADCDGPAAAAANRGSLTRLSAVSDRCGEATPSGAKNPPIGRSQERQRRGGSDVTHFPSLLLAPSFILIAFGYHALPEQTGGSAERRGWRGCGVKLRARREERDQKSGILSGAPLRTGGEGGSRRHMGAHE